MATIAEQAAELEKLGALVTGMAAVAKHAAEALSAADLIKATRKAGATSVTEETRGGKPRNFVTVEFPTATDANAFWHAVNQLRPAS